MESCACHVMGRGQEIKQCASRPGCWGCSWDVTRWLTQVWYLAFHMEPQLQPGSHTELLLLGRPAVWG